MRVIEFDLVGSVRRSVPGGGFVEIAVPGGVVKLKCSSADAAGVRAGQLVEAVGVINISGSASTWRAMAFELRA